jgi:hypothetical protein
MIMNTKSICIKETQVIYRICNSKMTGSILMISDLLDSSPYKNKSNYIYILARIQTNKIKDYKKSN